MHPAWLDAPQSRYSRTPRAPRCTVVGHRPIRGWYGLKRRRISMGMCCRWLPFHAARLPSVRAAACGRWAEPGSGTAERFSQHLMNRGDLLKCPRQISQASSGRGACRGPRRSQWKCVGRSCFSRADVAGYPNAAAVMNKLCLQLRAEWRYGPEPWRLCLPAPGRICREVRLISTVDRLRLPAALYSDGRSAGAGER